jgi:ABC-type phosphate/phosphonate transport system substrate-binding protein
MNGGVAALPMYDWPEARGATDRFWAAIRDRLRAQGVGAPEALDRGLGLEAGWTHPRLVLGQTCGLPLVGPLTGRVAVVGAADFGLPGCPPGWYRSAVVVRADDRRETLAAFRGARLAINGRDSQSGWGSILHHAAPLARDGGFFGGVEVTGAHVASVDRVAGGAADLAAIDLVTWGYCRRHRPAAGRLRVLMLTDPTPGLPYITAPGSDVEALRAAVAGAIAGLSDADRGELGAVGFVSIEAGAYALVAERLAAAASALRL